MSVKTIRTEFIKMGNLIDRIYKNGESNRPFGFSIFLIKVMHKFYLDFSFFAIEKTPIWAFFKV